MAASLAQFGDSVTFVSKIPSNAIGDCAVSTLRKLGVDCRHIARGGKRLGIYFLEMVHPYARQMLYMTEWTLLLQRPIWKILILTVFLKEQIYFMYQGLPLF